MNEPNAELKQHIASLAIAREELRLKKRRDLASHVDNDGDIHLLREKEGDDRVDYRYESPLIHLEGFFSAKQLRFLAEHIDKHKDSQAVIDY